jgi:hypothetical protein
VLLDDVPRRRHVGALLFMSQQIAYSGDLRPGDVRSKHLKSAGSQLQVLTVDL